MGKIRSDLGKDFGFYSEKLMEILTRSDILYDARSGRMNMQTRRPAERCWWVQNQDGICGRDEKYSVISKYIPQIKRKWFANGLAMAWERKIKVEDDSRCLARELEK